MTGDMICNVGFNSDELAKAFAAFGESIKKTQGELKCYSEAMRKLLVEKAMASFYTLVEDYTQASFLTRWYYKRKIEKMKYVMPELVKMVKDAFKEE